MASSLNNGNTSHKRARNRSATPERTKKIRGDSITKAEKRVQHYRQEWQNNETFKNWLRPVTNLPTKAQCILCKSEFVADISVIKTHLKGKKHIACVKSIGFSQVSIRDTMIKNNEKQKADVDLNLRTKAAEIKICAYIASQNIALRQANNLTSVCKSAFTDSKIAQRVKLARTKATNIVCNVIGKCHREELIGNFKISKFSVIIDEGTDIASLKTLAVCVRYFDEITKKITTKFWSLIQIFDGKDADGAQAGATGERLFDELVKSFEDVKIPLTNIIGFASDGCNVMFGEHNSVVSRMKKPQDGIVVLKCICHSLHLCASEACKTLPRHCEDLARNIHTFFNHSSKRQAALREFQDFCEVEPHKLLRPAQTRWLSLLQVVKRILEQWEALKLFFTDQWIEQKLFTAEIILNELNDNWLRLYYIFLEWVLPKVVKINEYFQSENVVITALHSKMVDMLLELLLTYMKSDAVKRHSQNLNNVQPDNEEFFLPLKQLYLGVNVMRKLQDTAMQAEPEKMNDFLYRCRTFLLTLCKQLQKRYDFSGEQILAKLAWFSPKNALRNDAQRPPTIASLLNSLPCIVPTTDLELSQKIDDQWRKLPFSSFPKEWLDKPVDEVWHNIRECKDLAGEKEFYEIGQFVLHLLVLPHSSASCERTFSKVNLIKTKIRNKLLTNTLNGLMLSSQCVADNGGNLFEPSKSMLNSMTTSSLYSHRKRNDEKQSQEKENREKNTGDSSSSDDEGNDEIIMGIS